jgi:hypothetical protein
MRDILSSPFWKWNRKGLMRIAELGASIREYGDVDISPQRTQRAMDSINS